MWYSTLRHLSRPDDAINFPLLLLLLFLHFVFFSFSYLLHFKHQRDWIFGENVLPRLMDEYNETSMKLSKTAP